MTGVAVTAVNESRRVSVTELTVLPVLVVAKEITSTSPEVTLLPYEQVNVFREDPLLCPPVSWTTPCVATLTVAGDEVTVTGDPALSVTWSSKDQTPTVDKLPVDADAGDVQDEDPPRLV